MDGDTLAAPQAAAEQTPVSLAVEALRLDWGAAYAIGYDDEHGWWAARHGRIGSLITAHDPAELQAGIATDYGPARP